MRKITFLFVVTFFSTISVIAQNKMKIVADFDAAIGFHDNYNTENNNYSKAIQNAAYTLPGASGGLNGNRALLHFDLSQLPKDMVVKSVKINLFALGNSKNGLYHRGNENASYLSRVTENWIENQVTWKNQPSTTDEHRVLLPNSTSNTQDYKDIDVTSLFKDILMSDNFGLKLELANENLENALFFASVDCGDSSKFPFLEIEFEEKNCSLKNVDYDVAIGYHDNYNTETNNYSKAIQNAAYKLPGASGGYNGNRALLFFDLSYLSKNTKILSAKLNLYALVDNGIPGHSGNNSAYIQRIVNDWKENEVTWNNQPSTTNINEVSLSKSDSSNQNYLDIDVTNLFSDMIQFGNYGIMLKLKNEDVGNALFFASKDFKQGSFSPTLDLCYQNIDSVIIDTNFAVVIENSKNLVIDLYPNPVDKTLNIYIPNFEKILNYRIVDINGVEVITNKINDLKTEIDLSKFNNGTYIFILTDSNNKNLTTRKIIVNH